MFNAVGAIGRSITKMASKFAPSTSGKTFVESAAVVLYNRIQSPLRSQSGCSNTQRKSVVGRIFWAYFFTLPSDVFGQHTHSYGLKRACKPYPRITIVLLSMFGIGIRCIRRFDGRHPAMLQGPPRYRQITV